MKQVVILFAAIIFTCNLFSQNIDLKLKEHLPAKDINSLHYKNSDLEPGLIITAIPLLLINPVLVFEDKKIFWGLTKEVSFSTFPYGRFSFEYSFLFRTFNKNHLRLSYNYDFIYQQPKEWIAYVISLGAGYFTDTKNKGGFAQASTGFFIPTPLLIIYPYIKYRYTKIFDSNKSDIHDISFGTGIVF